MTVGARLSLNRGRGILQYDMFEFGKNKSINIVLVSVLRSVPIEDTTLSSSGI